MQTRGSFGQQPLIPVGFHSFVVPMGLSYGRSVLPVLVVREYGQRVLSRVKRSAPMVCHALVVCVWGLGVPFVDFTGVPHRYCMLLWFFLRHGTTLPS